jgi:large subunit ribosomal protein L31e
MAEEIEKIYVIPLKKSGFKSSKSAPTAVKRVKSYLTRHMKVEREKIWIDDSLNNALWGHGKYHSPSKIRVKAVKFEDGVVEAYLPELEFKKSRRELLKEERAKKEPILKKEEPEAPGEAGEVPGAEEYDISPTGEGDVKIKKKKAPKTKKEKVEEKPKPKKKEEKEKPEEKPSGKKAETKKKTKKKPVKKAAKKTVAKPKKTEGKAKKAKTAKKKTTSSKK